MLTLRWQIKVYALSMTKYKLRTQYVPRHTGTQSEALDAIGDALKRRLIDFGAATTLRDLVRAGHVDKARTTLNEIASAPTQHVPAWFVPLPVE